MNLTAHAVLAGAYRNQNAASLLTHWSSDDGDTPLCGKVKAGNLCDIATGLVDCAACLKKAAKLAAK
jgi:hypothetical protein